MKVACPGCQQPIKVPDEWAGRTARCPNCKTAFLVPGEAAAPPAPAGQPPKPAAKPIAPPDGVDLAALAGLEPGTPAGEPRPMMDVAPPKPSRRGRGPAAKAPHASSKVIRAADGAIYRVCPHCGHQVKGEDLRSDVLCSNCWKSIPPAVEPEQFDIPKGQTLIGGRGRDRDVLTGFYEGLVSAFGYPVGAFDSMLMGTLVAMGVILFPTAVMMGLIFVMQQEPVAGKDVQLPAWSPQAIMGALLIELVYCAGVGFYALIDSIRSTLQGNEKPPALVWNLGTVTGTLIGYVGFLVLYALIGWVGLWVTGRGQIHLPTNLEDLREMLSPATYVWLAAMTFFVPMSAIGIAIGSGLQGLNPVRLASSIGATITHYIFLYCIMLVYAGLYGLALATMLDYTGEALLGVMRKGMEQGLDKIALAVIFWGVLLGAGFFGSYVLGRILGLYARDFQLKLSFSA